METFAEILKYILPSVVVLLAVWYLSKAFLDQELKKMERLQKNDLLKAALPLRMQAYERLVLLLERMQPAGLLIRVNGPGMNAGSFHAALIQAIREEFEHNLSQQLYVSVEVWELVKAAREEAIRLINSAASKIPQDASTTELAQQILIQDMEQSQAVTDKAIAFLKREAHDRFF